MPWCPSHVPACRPRGNDARRSVVRRWLWPRPLPDLVEPAADGSLIDSRDVELRVTYEEDRDTHDVAIEKSGIARDVDSFDIETIRAAQAAQPCQCFFAQSAVGPLQQADADHQFGGRLPTCAGSRTPGGWIT